MTLKAIIHHKHAKAALGGVIVALLGWQLCWLPFGQSLSHLSYDFPFLFAAPSTPANLVLVELDEVSFMELNQTYGQRWDRRLHARLLDHLRTDGANLVVFDVIFTELGLDAEADAELAQAIRAHGKVVLAAEVDDTRRNGIVGARIVPPADVFRDATTNWGPMQVERPDADGVVRTIYCGSEQKPAMTWVAASLIDNPAIRNDSDHLAQRWVRYYGPGGTLAHVSYSQAANQPADFYRGKTVFIGGRPKTRFVAEEVDEFLTPWKLHGQPQISGLELTATEFTNLARGDFLKRLPAGEEMLLLALLGILAGGGLACARPVRAVIFSVIGGLVVMAMGLMMFYQGNVWFSWAVAVLVQIPCALGWSLGLQWWRMKKEKEFLETPMPGLWDDLSPGETKQPAPPASATGVNQAAPAIPDHEMLRQVGRGAYGNVWLARDVLGNFHAVKIVRRAAFDHDAPYDREFRGLQKFTPVSREHPGLVHILHVGRNTVEDFFYYVMEAGDDEKSGATIDPATYTPRNLARDLHRRAPLPPGECVEIMAALCDALEFLHGHGLIHRDIKPANIIFVNGRPKLADVGLVTEISEQKSRASLVGTEGYLPPEGPGTTSGDIFALGRVLEEMVRVRETKTPSPLDEARDRLRLIARKASAGNPAERFTGAREMRDALLSTRDPREN